MDLVLVPITLAVDMVYDREVCKAHIMENLVSIYLERDSIRSGRKIFISTAPNVVYLLYILLIEWPLFKVRFFNR